ncbi:uncharacterized protein LOC122935155 [Bufo gargarizans]|uniref:uncharacterized protein LOC122935155 n=1 Tax=Bufo gargarizans TaxID=30331 RepID=UPI001CF51467|nr:uncharacterized protein LOC122935155 [Bufo gargarizans]
MEKKGPLLSRQRVTREQSRRVRLLNKQPAKSLDQLQEWSLEPQRVRDSPHGKRNMEVEFVSPGRSDETPRMGKGIWKLNSSLLEEAMVRQSFEDFLQSQEPLVDMCNSKSEWWEMFKKRTARFFRKLSNLRSWDRYRLYQELRKKLERLVSTGDSREDISRVKSLLKRCQYDRYASLVAERDFGKYRSPDPYGNCKMAVRSKLVMGLVDSTGSLNRSKSGILEVVRSFYSHLFGRKELNRDSLSAFLAGAIPGAGMDPSLDILTEPIREEEVRLAIDGLRPKKSPGPDGLTSEWYKTFREQLVPLLTEVYNECLSSGNLPRSMGKSVLILLTKGRDPSRIENWRPISLLNVDRKILAKILFCRLAKFAPKLLSGSQHCSVPGRSAFSAVLSVREAVERGRAGLWKGLLLSLDQAKAFDRVNHEYLWSVLLWYGLPGRFVDWLKTLYKGAESFPLVNGWLGRPFEVASGVRQGCPLSPLLYVFAIDPFIRRVDRGPLAGVRMELAVGGPSLKVVAYADDVSIFTSSEEEVGWVMSEVNRYSEVSGSQINRDKCETLWLGEGDPVFDLQGTLPEPQKSVKILGINFGQDEDYHQQNWEGRLKDVAQRVDRWKGWSLSLRERVHLCKAYLIPVLLYLSSVCVLPGSLWATVYSLFFQMLWGNRLNLIRREVTYRTRRLGGLDMVNPVVFLTNTFLKINIANLWKERAPLWVISCREWFRPFFQEWETGGRVKDLRASHGHLPAYVAPVLKIIRRWGLRRTEIETMSRGSLDRGVLSSFFQAPLALKDCPSQDLEGGLLLLNLERIPKKVWDVTWRCFHGKLYVRDNMKCRNSEERGCPREECGGVLESMDHFLLHCPFNIEVYKKVGSSIGWPRLATLSYAEWAYGAFKDLGGRDRRTLFLVMLFQGPSSDQKTNLFTQSYSSVNEITTVAPLAQTGAQIMVKIGGPRPGDQATLDRKNPTSGEMDKFIKKTAILHVSKDPKMAQTPTRAPRSKQNEPQDQATGGEDDTDDLPISRSFLKELLSSSLASALEPLSSDLAAIKQDISQVGGRVETLEITQEAIIHHQSEVAQRFQAIQQRMNGLCNSLEDQENRGRRNNLRFRGIPETVDTGDIANTVVQICMSLLGPESAHEVILERAHRALRPKPAPSAPPRDIICKFLSFPVKEAIILKARQSGKVSWDGQDIQIFQDLAQSTLDKRRSLKPLTGWLREHKIPYRWSFPFGLSFTYEGRRLSISNYADLDQVFDHLQIEPLQIENWDPIQDLSNLPELPHPGCMPLCGLFNFLQLGKMLCAYLYFQMGLGCESLVVKSDVTALPLSIRISLHLARHLLVFMFAIEEINRRSDLLPNITLGYKIYDSCVLEHKAVQSALSILSGREEAVPNYSCDEKNNVVAFIGHLMSTSSLSIAEITGIYGYPQISYGAMDPIFSNKLLFPYFYRTVPDGSTQYEAIVLLLEKFGWSWVGMVTVDDESSQRASMELHNL